MNTREAIQAMLEGKKVRGVTWDTGEYVFISKDGYIIDNEHNLIGITNSSNWEIYEIFNDHEAQLKAKDEEIEKLFGLIKSLWQIIDDIDTYGDMAKSDDALFRRIVENKQKERWKLPISTDGYEIFLKDNQ